MAGITLAQAEEQLAYWMNINATLGPNSEVEMAGQRFRRADVLQQVAYWDKQVKSLSSLPSVTGRSRVFRGVPA